MSSEVFENREDDFNGLYNDLKRKLEVQLPQVMGEGRKRLSRDIERGIEEGNILIQEMEDETKKAPGKFRTQMVTKARNYRRDLDQLSRDLKKTGDGNNGARPNVSFAPEGDIDSMESAQRARLMAGSESLNRTTDSIVRSHRIAAETDQIAQETIGELGGQREQLLHTRERLVETDSNLIRSRKILKSMARRVMTNKMILAVIIFLELGVLAGVIYWKFFS